MFLTNRNGLTVFLFRIAFNMMLVFGGYAQSLRAAAITWTVASSTPAGVEGSFIYDPTEPYGTYLGYDLYSVDVYFSGGSPSFSALISFVSVFFLSPSGMEGTYEGFGDGEDYLTLMFSTPLNLEVNGGSDSFT